MKSKLLTTLTALAFCAPSLAMALSDRDTGFFIEPMLTHETLDSEVNYPDPYGQSNGEADGLGLGLRLGAHVHEIFFIGLDARYSQLDYVATGGDYRADADTYNYGVLVGAQLPTPVSLRVWANYILGGQFDPEQANNQDVKFKSAEGYRFGLGIMFSVLSLNVEYQKITYDNSNLESIGPFNVGENLNNTEMKNDGYVISLSFPYAF